MKGVRPVGETLAVALLCGRDGACPVFTIIGRISSVDASPKFGGKVE
jgi:hypothetical protein